MKTKLFSVIQTFTFIGLLIFSQTSFAQNGLDPDFGQNGTVATPFAGSSATATHILQLNDNKLLAIGSAYSSNMESALFARYLVDGTLDISFGTNGLTNILVNGLETYFDGAIVDNAGKIYAVGEVQTSSNGYSAGIIRLTASGTLDTSFGTNGVVLTTFGTTLDAVATDITIQDDGKIIVSGVVDDNNDPIYDDLADFALARYNTDGTLDSSFGSAGYVITAFNANHYDALLSVLVQPDGKIVASGLSYTEDPNTFEDSADVVAARYTINGSLDTSFGDNGKVIINIDDLDYVVDMALQSDGKLLLCGDTSTETEGVEESLLVRLNTDGSLDTSFSDDGFIITSFFNSAVDFSTAFKVIANPDGSILTVGEASSNDGTLFHTVFAKYTANGSLDTSFRDDGKFELQNNNVEVYDAIVTNAGKLLVTGSKIVGNDSNNENHFYLAQYSLNNTLDIENFELNGISVYPNPVATILNLNFKTATLNTQVAIYDILGKMVAKLNTDIKNNSMDLSHLSNGIYYLQVVQNGRTFSEKIIKK